MDTYNLRDFCPFVTLLKQPDSQVAVVLLKLRRDFPCVYFFHARIILNLCLIVRRVNNGGFYSGVARVSALQFVQINAQLLHFEPVRLIEILDAVQIYRIIEQRTDALLRTCLAGLTAWRQMILI
uniref:hypothetical protein n=1 Tax=Marinobacterium profundum TaxID=1714300 RepID=UPI001FDEF32E|nr:hypothetical protein [Marinobacterium profundum]